MPPLPRKARKDPAGAPSWMVTFADLMTLLLTFFILLLSFSKMDVAKYKAMVASMASAFGNSKGAVTVVINQPTSAPSVVSAPTSAPVTPTMPQAPVLLPDSTTSAPVTNVVPKGVEQLAKTLIGGLQAQIAQKEISVRYNSQKVVIRFAEDATFPSGSADLKPAMVPIIDKVVSVLARCSGNIVVAGYTDNQPIVSSRYRSNWDLSAARAVSVVHQLILNRRIDAERVTAAGHAETHPLVPNTSPENRAINRRVEINIDHPKCEPGTSAPMLDMTGSQSGSL